MCELTIRAANGALVSKSRFSGGTKPPEKLCFCLCNCSQMNDYHFLVAR